MQTSVNSCIRSHSTETSELFYIRMTSHPGSQAAETGRVVAPRRPLICTSLNTVIKNLDNLSVILLFLVPYDLLGDEGWKKNNASRALA